MRKRETEWGNWMTNREVAVVLERIADILQIKEENPFKVRAYRKAAATIYHLDVDLNILLQEKKLQAIPGVGSGVQAIIEELLTTKQCEYYNELLEDYPPGVLDMLTLPGIGHATVRVIYEHLGIDNLNDLLQAAMDKKIRALPGLGAKTEYNIKKGIEMLKRNADKSTLGIALPMALRFCEYLRSLDGVTAADITGSIRRWTPLVSDIDLLAATHDFKETKRQIRKYREIHSITLEEDDHLKGLLDYNIPFEVILVKPENYYPRLVWTTGSKAHRGVLVAEYGFNPDLCLAVTSEAEVYKKMNLMMIPPELRENTGEIEAALKHSVPVLVETQDIKGDLHVHSDWSDGAHKITDIVNHARKMGYSYVAITDHSKSLTISRGLNHERLHAQARVIDELNSVLGDFKILKGIEVDIMRDGSLDFEDDVLKELDIVVASIHSHFKLNQEEQTARIIRAIENRYVTIIGHLTGRLLTRRSGYEVDLDRILKAAAQNNVALEINSHPDRLDVDEHTVRQACAYGVKLAINSDAHDVNELANVCYGVSVARRGWAQKSDVLNTMDLKEFNTEGRRSKTINTDLI
jgi:DNA polymerase (family 10)